MAARPRASAAEAARLAFAVTLALLLAVSPQSLWPHTAWVAAPLGQRARVELAARRRPQDRQLLGASRSIARRAASEDGPGAADDSDEGDVGVGAAPPQGGSGDAGKASSSSVGSGEDSFFEDVDMFDSYTYLDEAGAGGSGVADSDEQRARNQPAFAQAASVGFRKMQEQQAVSAAMKEITEMDPEIQRLMEDEVRSMGGDVEDEAGLDVSEQEVDEFLAEIGGKPLVDPVPAGRTPIDPFERDSTKELDIFEELRKAPSRQLIYERGMPDKQLLLTVKDRLRIVAEAADAGDWKAARFTMRGLWRKRKLRLPLGRILWNLMIKAHSRAGRPKSAEMWLTDMLNRVYQPDIYSFNSVLAGFAKKGDFLKVEYWIKRMAARGVKPDMWSFTALANAYSQGDDLMGTERAVERMEASGCKVSNAFAYNAILKLCAKRGDVDRAERWLQCLADAGITGDRVTYLLVIRTCGQARNMDRAAHWIAEMESAGFTPGRPQLHAAMIAHARSGDLDGAEAWMRVMDDRGMPPDVYSYNTLIAAAAQQGDSETAKALVARMEEDGVSPDVVTYSTVIGALAEARDAEGARDWLYRAEDQGLEPDLRCYNNAIQAFANVGNSSAAEHLVRRLLRHSLTPDAYTYNILLRSFEQDGSPAASEFWIDHMQRSARWRHTRFPLHQMSIAYMHVLKAYVRAGNLEAAEAWHSQMLSEGVEPDPRCYIALIQGHLDQGHGAEAKKWCHRMTSWSNFQPPEALKAQLLDAASDQARDGPAMRLEEERVPAE
mmetsp:Transcript_30055/g.82520  ORF Transcript_30055/g.82520 Transcript_30055/m.82520 type:complete len:777 (-) Transcript_30055:42-2372(-)